MSEQSRDEVSMRARTRGALERIAPAGSSTRAMMRLARQMAKDGVRFGEHLRHVWRVARELQGDAHEYRHWLHDQRPEVNSLLRQTDPAQLSRIRTRVELIVLPGTEADAAWGR